MAKDKVILAYSGGLDTSVILKWLLLQDYEVICYMADVGQDEDFEAAREKALKIGASKVYIEDLKREFVTDFIFPAIKCNALYEGRYLLGTSLARPCIARRQVQIAREENAAFVSHGATGKGNDQVRFELTFYALEPEIQVIAPWRMTEFTDQFKGRTDLLNFAREHGIPISMGEKPPYSMDENLMHISYESGDLEEPENIGGQDVYLKTGHWKNWADEPETIRLHFKDGTPIKVENTAEGKEITDPLELYMYLHRLGCKHGVGRIDIVENRFVGIKSRGIYETPGATILRAAHVDIEGIAMDREVLRLRDMLSTKFSEIVYNGFWFSPEMEFMMAAMHKAQEVIDGWVDVWLYKGNCMAVARYSPSSLYDSNLASMESIDSYNPADAEGFIKINAVRLKAHRQIIRRNQPADYDEASAYSV
eukprot:Clim_evm41s172 gene=Clim_evmTU41s172